MASEPKTLQEAILYFADNMNCLNYMVARRWPNGVACPTCGSTKVHFQPKHFRWQCAFKHPKRQFTAKVGTIFEDSPIGLDKWLTAVWMITSCKNGVSSYEIHRALGVTQKTAWFMLHRIRLAMQDELTGGKLDGEIEVDETYIGGKIRNMHKDRRERIKAGRKAGPIGKAVVQGMLQRGGKVRFAVVGDTANPTALQKNVREHIEPGSHIYTDEARAYFGLTDQYLHEFVNHAEEYVRGNCHTNGLESFWSMLKRTLGGTYISVEPFHLFRYVDEQAFRFNNRKEMTDADRFREAMNQIVGRRLTYSELTGKDDPATTQANC
jgi:transposase-like protein